MKLCEELEAALGRDAVFYGVPQRRRGEPTHTRRLFKLNGLWFEPEIHTFTEIDSLAGSFTPKEAGLAFDPIVQGERIAAIRMVPSAEVGAVSLPRPAIVAPVRTKEGNLAFDDTVVQHRHMVFGNARMSRSRARFAWEFTPLNEERPWLRLDGRDALAISEYTSAVRERQGVIEDRYAERIAHIVQMRAAEKALARARLDEKEAADNPLWGTW